MKSIWFNAHHSPMGAFASFTLGQPGATGGIGQELGGPANQNLYIGVESAKTPGQWDALPFFKERQESDAVAYDVEAEEDLPDSFAVPYPQENVTRDFELCTDTWRAEDFQFQIVSPVFPIPNPDSDKVDEEACKLALVPSVLAEMTIDNTTCDHDRTAYFVYRGEDPYSFMWNMEHTLPEGYVGVGQGRVTGIFSDSPHARPAQHFDLPEILEVPHKENETFLLGPVGGILIHVPAGEIVRARFSIAFFRDGVATAGLDTSYLYTRYFENIQAAGTFALDHFEELAAIAEGRNEWINESTLSDDQQFQLKHAIRSYYGSSQLLEESGKALWVVNEGEYRMINTFDLTVDHLYFELAMNPWVVRNVLDLFVDRYSYEDKVRFPGDETEYPGGISFTHDMGVANVFTRPHYSSYECFKLDGCFSHMTHEQLVNWICCACTYGSHTGDQDWLIANKEIFERCLDSMLNRDHPDPEQRNGIMALDSTRTMGGAEITTYDSLDVSLGQSRNNVYMAVKCWASYVCLEKLFQEFGDATRAQTARVQAYRCAKTLSSKLTEGGYIPAVIDEGNDSKIIPAIEGLVFPYLCGLREILTEDGPYGNLIKTLKTHLNTVLVPGTCLFDNGAWKISSTSNNSWLSKIYLSQFVARKVLGLEWGDAGAKADAAHVDWLLDPENAYFAWSDQMVNGKARGSKYYPRGVTSILWLSE